MKYLLTYFIFLFFSLSYAQDSLSFSLMYEMKGRQSGAPLGSPSIPNDIPLRDNPFNHFGIYAGTNFQVDYESKYKVNLGYYIEERNHSRGAHVLDQLVTFPYIHFSMNDTLRLTQDDQIEIYVKGGDLWDEDFNDILRIYNLDFQGYVAKIKFKRFGIGIYKSGDLSRGVGLNLHEYIKYLLEYTSDKLYVGLGGSVNEIHNSSDDQNYTLVSKINFSKNLNGTFQYEIRSPNEGNNSSAYGFSIDYKKSDLFLSLGLKNYRAGFNLDYLPINPSFDGYYSNEPGNFVGEVLYPLKNFYRPFNQWNFFTSFGGSNLWNIEFKLFYEKQLYRKLYFTCDLDVNAVNTSNARDTFVWPFYDIGLRVKFADQLFLDVTGSNKVMNLYSFYQTFSASQDPIFTFTITANGLLRL